MATLKNNKTTIVCVCLAAIIIVFGSCSHQSKAVVILQMNKIDSIEIIKREEGQLYSSARHFFIKEVNVFDTIYQSYINDGKLDRDYPIKIPAGRYMFITHRSVAANDTVMLWHDMARVKGLGVVYLPRNIEPYLDGITQNYK